MYRTANAVRHEKAVPKDGLFYAVSYRGIHEPLSHFVMHVTDK